MNEKMSKRRIQIIDFQKQEIEEKEETTLLIRLHIFYKILTINLIQLKKIKIEFMKSLIL